MAIGDYTRTTWQNGAGVGHPPINAANLNNIEAKLNEIDNYLESMSNNYRFKELKNYFWDRNCKSIEYFDVKDDFTAIAGTTLNVIATQRTGNADVTFQDSDNVAGTIGLYRTISSVNLNEFNGGIAAGNDEIIVLSVDITDHTFYNNITIKLGDDAANYYSITFAAPASSGRYDFYCKKSDFATTGAPTGWNDITYVRIEASAKINSSGEYIALLSLMMYRNDPDNDGEPNPFQIYKGAVTGWVNQFTVNAATWHLMFDPAINELGIIRLNDYSDPNNKTSLLVKSSMKNFVWNTFQYSKTESSTNTTSMVWYVDSNNYIEVCCEADNFLLYAYEAGAGTSNIISLDISMHTNEMFEIYFEKNGASIIAKLKKNGEYIKILEYETSIDTESEGDLYFGNYGYTGISYIVDWIISNVNNVDLDVWDKPKLVVKKSDESINNDTTYLYDSELYCYLPRGMYEIELNLGVLNATSDVPDFKTIWELTNASALSSRSCIGPDTSVTNPDSSGAMQTRREIVTTGIKYGVTSVESNICEIFIIYAKSGCKVNFKRGQFIANASNTVVREGSYLKITKVELLQQYN